jgi:crotonobetainyl-CoA:carnitine CoA-transferase CaiB-like acyl-CoA transferase
MPRPNGAHGQRALSGIRVVDVSDTVAAAWGTRLLADFGADVVVVESPEHSPLRRLAPFDGDESLVARHVLANKRSVVLDPARPPERDRLLRLIAEADVLVESAGPGWLSAMDVARDDVGARWPALVHALITPHGIEGGREQNPGNDLTAWARSGWASINGLGTREPLKGSGHSGSYVVGAAAYGAIVTALVARAHDGLGQTLDLAEVEALAMGFGPVALRGQHTGVVPQRLSDNLLGGLVPVRDGYFSLSLSRAHFWRDALNLLGLPDLAEDRRYDVPAFKEQQRPHFVPRIREKMAAWSKADLFEAFATLRIVGGAVLSMDEVAADAHIRARSFPVQPEDDPAGPAYVGAPAKLSVTPWALRRRAPRAGEHTAAVLAELESGRRGSVPAPTADAPDRPPLAGIRVLSLTHAWAGPYCTSLLGLMGAEVIAIEARRRPDNSRGGYSSPLQTQVGARGLARHSWNCASSYNGVNQNKLSLTIDLQTADGIALFRELVLIADVVVENYSPRVLTNLGIDYGALKKLRPDIILCSISAFGHDGPRANFPGIGGTVEATSGMSSLFGYPDGPPLNSGADFPDSISAYYAYASVVTALFHRERTGEGQYIDLSMQDATLTTLGDAMLEYLATGRVRPRLGNRSLSVAPHGIYPTAGDDRWLALAAQDGDRWRALCEVAGRPDWAGDPRFASNGDRLANVEALDALIAGWTASQDRDALASRLVAAGVIAAPVLNGHEVVADPVLRARGFVNEVEHPETGRWWQLGSPFKLSRTPRAAAFHAPCQGEHSASLLEQLLAVTPERYADLERIGVSGSGPPP